MRNISKLKTISAILFLSAEFIVCNPLKAQKDVGAVKPTWESLEQNYRVPEWLYDAKFGIFMHWGVYAVPAHQSEWYCRHMYSNAEIAQWHREHFGPQDKFGYKDFIPLFTADKWDPEKWAELFKEAGARYIVPTAEHHDGFALWDSDLTRWDAKEMGPHRDLIGDLAKAVRAQGLKFGVSDHNMEHWDFMYPQLDIKNDLFDPAFADFYGPPQKPQTPISRDYQENYWFARAKELVDKYQPDMVWFDNGVNGRELDSIKLKFAAYYYNKAREWGKQVTVSTKKNAYPDGSFLDFERQSRAPEILTRESWQVDEPIGYRFGYLANDTYKKAPGVIRKLVENVSRNGNLLFNISPMADGTIPAEQQNVLLEIGQWLKINGEGIYSSRPWIKFGEGPSVDGSPDEIRFTTREGNLFAFLMKTPRDNKIIITSLSASSDMVNAKSVSLLGYNGTLSYSQTDEGLEIVMPEGLQESPVYAFKIKGISMKQPVLRYDFGPGKTEPGYVQVNASDLFSKARGYGFFGEGEIIGKDRKGRDALRSDFITSNKPFYFQTSLEEGNYEVTVVFGDRKGTSANTVKAESRRLMVDNLITNKGECRSVTFMVNVRTPRINRKDSISLKPREKVFLNWDNKLTLEFNGPKPCIDAIEIKKSDSAINVFLAGNSTVVDQEHEPWASWGQMIPLFFNNEIVIANYAESGEALKSFQREKRLEKIISLMQKGDYLFIEFAHNDQKPGSAYVEPFTTYKEEIRRFIRETWERGGIPVLVTSINRRQFDENGKIVNTLGDYPEAMRQLAREEKVAFIDLNSMSKALFEAMGVEGTKKAFVHYPEKSFPGQDKALADNTHFSNYGAYELAKCVVEGIRISDLKLKKYLKEFPVFDPSRPDPFESITLPESPSISNLKPDGN